MRATKFIFCASCYENYKRYNNERQKARRDKHAANGRCPTCGKEKESEKYVNCTKCKERIKKCSLAYSKKKRSTKEKV